MKSKSILVCVVAVLLLCLSGCSSASKQVDVTISCDDFAEDNHISRQVEVNVGDSLVVTLCSNPTTGFTWTEWAEISDQDILQQMAESEFVPAGGNVVGAAGQQIWTFEALKKGTVITFLEYSRPWIEEDVGH